MSVIGHQTLDIPCAWRAVNLSTSSYCVPQNRLPIASEEPDLDGSLGKQRVYIVRNFFW